MDITSIPLPSQRTYEQYLIATFPPPRYIITRDEDYNPQVIDTDDGSRVRNVNGEDGYGFQDWQWNSFSRDFTNAGYISITLLNSLGINDDTVSRSPTAQRRGLHTFAEWIAYEYGPGVYITDPRDGSVYFKPNSGNVIAREPFDFGLGAPPDFWDKAVLAVLVAAITYGAQAAITGTTLTTPTWADSLSFDAAPVTGDTAATVTNGSNFVGDEFDYSFGDESGYGYGDGAVDSSTYYNPDGSVVSDSGYSTAETYDANTYYDEFGNALPAENVPVEQVQQIEQAAQTGAPAPATQSIPQPPVKATPSILQQLGINPTQLITSATGAVLRYVTTGTVNGVPQYSAQPVRLPNGQYAYVGANGQVIGGGIPSGYGGLSQFFSNPINLAVVGAGVLMTVMMLQNRRG